MMRSDMDSLSLNSPATSNSSNSSSPERNAFSREDLSEYVAHLQLHMTLQARNLVPSMYGNPDNRSELLQETQATFEKLVSRQSRS